MLAPRTLIGCAVLLGAASPVSRAESPDKPWEPAAPIVGTLEEAEFAERLPMWEQAALDYAPAPEVVELLRAAAPARVEVYFGAWCHDSFDHVPVLLAALRTAANPALTTVWIGIDRAKTEPEGRATLRRIERVPTIVVLRDDQEIGRVVEIPATTMDRDVASILTGEAAAPRSP